MNDKEYEKKQIEAFLQRRDEGCRERLKISELRKIIFTFDHEIIVFWQEGETLKYECSNQGSSPIVEDLVKEDSVIITIPLIEYDKKHGTIGAREEYASKIKTIYDVFQNKYNFRGQLEKQLNQTCTGIKWEGTDNQGNGVKGVIK